jgi:polysaccharide pyruvyl transferase WcaK-like protein
VKLIHLANFNSTNIGNGALIDGLESTIEEDFAHKPTWQREAWDDYTFRLKDFDDAFVSKVNHSNGLIVGGAVTFNGRDYNTHTGTRFELPLELWSSIKKPVVFYGLSYRHWQGQTYHHADKLKLTIEKILSSKNMLLSLRNDGTREWLKAMTGIDSNAILEVPDSAVFVRAKDGKYPEIMAGGVRNVIVAFNDEDAANRYSGKSRAKVIDALAAAIEKLAAKYPLNIILCPHYFDDFKMLSDFIARINPRLAHQNTITTGLCRAAQTGAFYGRYQKADLAISMRVHSMSPCIGLGTPMVPFTTQTRMTDFLARIGLADQAVDAFHAAAPEKLYEKAVYTLEHAAEVRAAFGRARAAMREQTTQFHRHIYEFLSA